VTFGQNSPVPNPFVPCLPVPNPFVPCLPVPSPSVSSSSVPCLSLQPNPLLSCSVSFLVHAQFRPCPCSCLIRAQPVRAQFPPVPRTWEPKNYSGLRQIDTQTNELIYMIDINGLCTSLMGTWRPTCLYASNLDITQSALNLVQLLKSYRMFCSVKGRAFTLVWVGQAPKASAIKTQWSPYV
jgi:hypothetical protein